MTDLANNHKWTMLSNTTLGMPAMLTLKSYSSVDGDVPGIGDH
jgi:hypothetical protein